jgi:hypothetical protein
MMVLTGIHLSIRNGCKSVKYDVQIESHSGPNSDEGQILATKNVYE